MKGDQIMTNRNTVFPAILVACFGFLPIAHAVIPPPDGGYPGGNTAVGQNALLSLTTGGFNTAVGWLSLGSNVTGPFNTAVGAGALLATTAERNTATGAGALLSTTAGYGNTADGSFALLRNTTGHFNTAAGVEALYQNTTGFVNTANGWQALYRNTTGSGNTALGALAGLGVTTADHVICIGAVGANVSSSCFISNIYEQVAFGGLPVFVNSDDKLGTLVSSKRFKEDIRPTEQASEALFALKPITFRYKKEIDPAGTSQFGLVAEDVEKVNPDLVVRDKKGRAYSVRYDQVNAMLLNEFLKEHRKAEQLKKDFESKFAEQQAQIEALASDLRKVNAQLDLQKPGAQTIVKY
jgi:hypothetical protein